MSDNYLISAVKNDLCVVQCSAIDFESAEAIATSFRATGHASVRGKEMKLYSEWFWSKSSAEKAAAKVVKLVGGNSRVHWAMRADGSHDWLAEVLA